MASRYSHIFGATAALGVLSFAGCKGSFSTAPVSPSTNAAANNAAASRQTPIKHVILIIQENRSFDNFFAGYPGADSTMVGKTHDGKSVPLKAITFSKVPLNHFYRDARTDINGGQMNGFDLVKPNPPFSNHIPYSYVKRSLIKP
ncbi:MAG TPA: alkaline phosphatase family protein, partial [Candidatus Tumulicola sp.]